MNHFTSHLSTGLNGFKKPDKAHELSASCWCSPYPFPLAQITGDPVPEGVEPVIVMFHPNYSWDGKSWSRLDKL